MSASANNGQLGRQLRDIKRRSQQRKLLRQTVAFAIGLLLMVLLMLATGCASQPPLLCEPLPPTPLPALTQPLPLELYSTRQSENFKRWQQRVTGTSVTSKP